MTHLPDYRANAIAAGVFFIIATAFLFVGEIFYGPVLTADDPLAAAATGRSQVALGTLIEFSCVIAIPLVAIALYPVLKRVSASLAIGYVAFRLFEAAIFASMEIDMMFVVELAEAQAALPGADPAATQVLINALTPGDPWSGAAGPFYNIVFVIGMLMLNAMLWTSRLVPRWISGWGVVSALVFAGLAIAAAFLTISETVALPLIVPLAVQEMVLALWFIFKGFSQPALDALPAA